jgi:hypothetical protein
MPQFPPVGLPVGGNQSQPGQPQTPNPSQQQIGRGQNSLGNMPQNPVLNRIQEGLTSPQPGLSAGGQAGGTGGPMGQQIGGGIAGVASKLEADSIKIYNEHQKYNEWEFIYDFSKPKGAAGQPGQATQNAGANTDKNSNSNSNSSGFGGGGFGGGGSSGFGSGSGSGFGSGGFGSGSGQGGSRNRPPGGR